jgi:hypothetical protein
MRIAWLEQSGELQDRETLLQSLSQEGIDFYRLNWRDCSNDKYCNVIPDSKCSWSKGRELLYDASSCQNYDYYIFVDDDIIFNVELEEAFNGIKSTLSSLNPAILTIASQTWHESYIRSTKAVVPIFLTDLQLQIMRADVARRSFPVKFDGGWGTLWYPVLEANKTNPGSVLSLRNIMITNTRQNLTGEYGGIENKNAADIWRRSEQYTSNTVRAMARALGHQRTIRFLNFIYANLRRPNRRSPGRAGSPKN